MWGQICLYNGIPDFGLQSGLWILSFGHEQPLIFIRPVGQSNQVREDIKRLRGALRLTGVKEKYST